MPSRALQKDGCLMTSSSR